MNVIAALFFGLVEFDLERVSLGVSILTDARHRQDTFNPGRPPAILKRSSETSSAM